MSMARVDLFLKNVPFCHFYLPSLLSFQTFGKIAVCTYPAKTFEIFLEVILIQVFAYTGQSVAWDPPCNCISDSNVYARKAV